MIKTLRRDKLLRDLRKGLHYGMCNYRHTDDYAFDDSHNFGKTNFLEVNIRTESKDPSKEGHINLWESDFRGSCGSAWINDDGTVTLVVHSNLSYDFKPKKAA